MRTLATVAVLASTGCAMMTGKCLKNTPEKFTDKDIEYVNKDIKRIVDKSNYDQLAVKYDSITDAHRVKAIKMCKKRNGAIQSIML